MKRELSINPRKWSKEDVASVWTIASSKGKGEVVELFPKFEDEGGGSPTYCQIRADGFLYVWFYTGSMITEFRFRCGFLEKK